MKKMESYTQKVSGLEGVSKDITWNSACKKNLRLKENLKSLQNH